jgi:uncharacterized repeat protein (TIGR01451 family)
MGDTGARSTFGNVQKERDRKEKTMKTRIHSVRGAALIALIAVLLASLATIPAAAQDATYTLTINAGDGQSVWAGTHFLNPLQVTVTDGTNPVQGVSVTFSAPDPTAGASAYLTGPGSAYSNSLTVTTDADGVASANATANCTPGGPYQVVASVGDQSATFSLTNSGPVNPAYWYCRDSYWMADPLDPGHEPPAPDTPIDSAVEGYWWRDTSNQNALAQHTAEIGTDTIVPLYTSSTFSVYVFMPPGGLNITLLTTPKNYMIVGSCGGGSNEATYAKNRLGPLISGKLLRGIVLADSTPRNIWGCRVWTKGNLYANIYGSSSYRQAQQHQFFVETELWNMYRRFLGTWLNWGADLFLGSGSMKQYRASPPQIWEAATVYIKEPTAINFEGNTIELLPASGATEDNLMVYMPGPKILSAGNAASWQLADVGLIPGYKFDPVEMYQTLDHMRILHPDMLIPQSGPPLMNATDALNFVLVQEESLSSIWSQTLNNIQRGYNLDQTQKMVELPANLANSPYSQEFASDLPSIVRAIWTNYLGDWDEYVTTLASTVSETDKAQILADAYGGADKLIEAAKQAELAASDLASADKALYLADAAYRVAPDNFEAKQVYAQALRKNAFMQTSAYKRNYYLSVAIDLGTEQVVSDILKTGQEDTALSFSAAEFSENFSGISGALLAAVRIDNLPDANSGVLTLAGSAVTAGQEIAVGDLDGLLFTPVANWNGQTSFLWNGKDGSGYAADDASVRITLDPVNDPPTISDTPLADVSVDEDAADSTIDLSTGFTDVDIATNGDVLTYTAESSNSDLVSTAVDGATLTLAYGPNKNGSATITVTATDQAGASVTDDLTVAVNPVNDAPTAQDAAITVVAGKSQAITLDYGDLETAQADLQVSFSSPINGTLDTSALPSLTYTAPSTAGDDSFTYTVTDRGDPDGCTGDPPACSPPQSATATIQVTVLPAPSGSISGVVFNDANGNGTLDDGEGGLASVTVQLQDADGNVLEETTTAADGNYAFTGLAGGAYSVSQSLLPGSVATTPLQVDVTLAESGAETVNFGQVVSADLRVDMTYSVNNKKIIFAITVTNDGPADALDAALTDVLPDTVAYVSAISTQGTCAGGKTVNCSFGTIASGGSATVTIQVNRVNTKEAVVNTATVTSSIFDIDMADNSFTVTIE